MNTTYRRGLQSIECHKCRHRWSEDVDIVGNGLDFVSNEYQLCPECGEEFTADDFVGEVRPW